MRKRRPCGPKPRASIGRSRHSRAEKAVQPSGLTPTHWPGVSSSMPDDSTRSCLDPESPLLATLGALVADPVAGVDRVAAEQSVVRALSALSSHTDPGTAGRDCDPLIRGTPRLSAVPNRKFPLRSRATQRELSVVDSPCSSGRAITRGTTRLTLVVPDAARVGTGRLRPARAREAQALPVPSS
jgi:hypothetical protein